MARTIWLISVKDLRLLLRDRMALFWVVGFPLLFGAFFGAVLEPGLSGELQPLPVRVVVEDDGPQGEQLARRLAADPRLRIARDPRHQAEHAVRTSKAVGYIRVLPTPQPAATPGATPPPSVELVTDPARTAETSMLEQSLLEALQPEAARRALPFKQRTLATTSGVVRSGYDVAFPAAIVWGLMGCAAAFAVSIVAERNRGTLLRLRLAPVRAGTLMAGKGLACLIACVTDVLLLAALGVLVFGVNIDSGPWLAITAVACAICFCGIMAALSVLGRTEQAVAGSGWSTLILMAMLGGGMVPLSLMPDWLVVLSDISPVKWGILALEGAAFRGFDGAMMATPLAVLLGTGAIGFAIGWAQIARTGAVR